MAIQRQSDPGRIKTESPDTQRDLAAKGGPAIGLGDAQNRQVPTPADDDPGVQSVIKKENGDEENGSPENGQIKSRQGDKLPGSNQ